MPAKPPLQTLDELSALYNHATRMPLAGSEDAVIYHLYERLTELVGDEHFSIFSLCDQEVKVFHKFMDSSHEGPFNYNQPFIGKPDGLLKKVFDTARPHWFIRKRLAAGENAANRETFSDDPLLDRFFGLEPDSLLILPICSDPGRCLGFVVFPGYAGESIPLEEGILLQAACHILCAARTISERRRGQQKALRLAMLEKKYNVLQQKTDFFKSVFNNFRNGMLTVDNHLQVTNANQKATFLLGYPLKKLLRRKLHQIIKTSEEEVRQIFKQGGKCVDPHTGMMTEFEFITQDGSTFPVEACFSAILDADGAITGLTCSFRDVTVKKTMEKGLARIDRLASLGVIASGIAHEIKNPLAAMAGVLQNLADNVNWEGKQGRLFSQLLSQIGRIDTVINSLMQFAEPQIAALEHLQANEIIAGILPLVENQLARDDIELVTDFDPANPAITGDLYLLQQALINIIMNACEAMVDQDQPRRLMIMTCGHREQCPCSLGDFSISPPANTINIIIADTGCGLNPTESEHIFDPFYTTKATGNGLGLAIAQRIIEQHHGIILVNNHPDGGTIFTVSLPIKG
ncbi:MAG: PAS domain S-box protein [Deltaproteobacteria bacterium]|nr:PAS domain S-box protein [Deltaproteobacteria bacterium]